MRPHHPLPPILRTLADEPDLRRSDSSGGLSQEGLTEVFKATDAAAEEHEAWAVSKGAVVQPQTPVKVAEGPRGMRSGLAPGKGGAAGLAAPAGASSARSNSGAAVSKALPVGRSGLPQFCPVCHARCDSNISSTHRNTGGAEAVCKCGDVPAAAAAAADTSLGPDG